MLQGRREPSPPSIRAYTMFLTIAVIILVLWALGAFIVPIGGGLIHILLVLALISLVYHLMTGRRVV